MAAAAVVAVLALGVGLISQAGGSGSRGVETGAGASTGVTEGSTAFAAILPTDDAELVDTTRVAEGYAGPGRNITIWQQPGTSNGLAVAAGAESAGSSLEYYPALADPEGSTAEQVAGTTVQFVSPSEDSGGLRMARWNVGDQVYIAAARGLDAGEFATSVKQAASDQSLASVAKTLPRDFVQTYRGEDVNPLFGLGRPHVTAVYEFEGSEVFLTFTPDPTRTAATATSFAFLMPDSHIRETNGDLLLEDGRGNDDPGVSLIGDGYVLSVSPSSAAEDVFARVQFVDEATWTSHAAGASEPGSRFTTVDVEGN